MTALALEVGDESDPTGIALFQDSLQINGLAFRP
jgi:hypothetical protein